MHRNSLVLFSSKRESYESSFASLFIRFFTNNSGWTLPALFATLRDLRDLAFDVRALSRSLTTADVSAGRRASTGRESEE